MSIYLLVNILIRDYYVYRLLKYEYKYDIISVLIARQDNNRMGKKQFSGFSVSNFHISCFNYYSSVSYLVHLIFLREPIETMVRADESALSFFRRKLLPKIHFQQLDRIDSIEYGQCYEIQINPLDISQGVLSLIFHFLISAEKGHVYHFSTADNLYYSLQQSGLDLSGSPAARANTEGRFLAGSVYSCQQITEFFKLISTTGSSSSNTSTDKDSSTTSSAGGGSSSVRNTVKQHNSNSNYSYEPTLVILEALSPILISEKVRYHDYIVLTSLFSF